MSASVWFWIIYVICGLFGGFFGWQNRAWLWPGLIVYVLIGLLGWGVFGAPIR